MVKCRIWTNAALAALTLPARVRTDGWRAVSQENYTANTFYFVIRAKASSLSGMTCECGLGCCRSEPLLLPASQILLSSVSCRRGSAQKVRLSLYQMLWIFLISQQLRCSLFLFMALTRIGSVLLLELYFCIRDWKPRSEGCRYCGIFKNSSF